MGWLLLFLGRKGNHLGLTLVNHVSRPLAGAWWIGPGLVLFCWFVVPVMRRTGGHNIMEGDDFGQATRFWWAPGWPWLGLVGAGLCLVAGPLLHPALARRWEPSAWFGMTADLDVSEMAGMVLLGLGLIGFGLRLYVTAWVRVRQDRYKAWNWRKGSQGQRPRYPKGCPFADQCDPAKVENKQ